MFFIVLNGVKNIIGIEFIVSCVVLETIFNFIFFYTISTTLESKSCNIFFFFEKNMSTKATSSSVSSSKRIRIDPNIMNELNENENKAKKEEVC